MMDRRRVLLIAVAALVAGLAIGCTLTLGYTPTRERQTVTVLHAKEHAKTGAAKQATKDVARGPEVIMERIPVYLPAKPGAPKDCPQIAYEERRTERGPVQEHTSVASQLHSDVVREHEYHQEVRMVVAPLPRWSAAAYGGLGSDGTRAAVSLGYRLFGPVSVELMASSLVQPVKSPAVLAGLRVSF